MTRTTCYSDRASKLAQVCGLDQYATADDAIKAAIERITQSGNSATLTLDEWLELGNNYRSTKEHS